MLNGFRGRVEKVIGVWELVGDICDGKRMGVLGSVQD